jgi:hypothetical protein
MAASKPTAAGALSADRCGLSSHEYGSSQSLPTQAQTTRRYTQGMVREESLAAVAALTASLKKD